MRKKTRKFQEGGFSAAQEKWLGGADRTDPYILARMRSAVPDEPVKKPVYDDSPAGKTGYGEENELPQTETVTKTTVSKTPATPAAKPAKPAATGPSQAEIDAEKKRMEDIGKRQGLERVTPETTLIGGGGLKVLQMAGKKLAEKIAGNRGLKEYVVPKLTGPSSSSSTPALPSPTPRLPYDKAGAKARQRSERATTREETMRRENAERYGVTDTEAPGYEALRNSMMRKGGKVKAKAKTSYKSGGSVSSASKRADGCAIRGKTRA
jgi:hypothetical protein